MTEFLIVASLHFAAVTTPGQDFVWIVGRTLEGGKRAGILSALGIALGILIYSILSIFGIQFIFKKLPALLLFCKLIGSCYLFYMGYLMINANNKLKFGKKHHYQKICTLIKKALFVNLSNVKAFLFFIMLFTVAIKQTTPTSTLIWYGLWMCFATWAWFSFVSLIFGQLKIRTMLLKHVHIIDKISGLIFICFAIAIAYTIFTQSSVL